MAVSYGIISSPWCVKPLFGFVSDTFGIFDWGRRRPYIAFTGLAASVVYVYMRIFIHDRAQFVGALTLISALICFADVCADSVMVEMCKRETVKGKLQSTCWMTRAFGGLLGSLFGGIAYNSLGAVATFHICASVTAADGRARLVAAYVGRPTLARLVSTRRGPQYQRAEISRHCIFVHQRHTRL